MGQACIAGAFPAAPRSCGADRPPRKGINMSTEHSTGESPGPDQPAAGQRPDLSRRSVIRGAAGLAGAGLAAGAITGAIAAPAAAAAARPARTAGGGASPAGPVIVHVRDIRSGEMDVFAGTSHTRLTDPGLAARLVRGVS
jgi:hypothetical protein